MKILEINLHSILEEKNNDTSRYFMMVTCLVAAIILALLSVIQFFLIRDNFAPFLFSTYSSFAILGLYFFVRYTKYLFISKLFLSVAGLISLDLTMYAKFLSYGPVLYFIFAFGALIIWVWDSKTRNVLMAFYVLNLFVLFFIEYYSPNIYVGYPDLETRRIDIYLSFFLYSCLLIFLLFVVKRQYSSQQSKAVHSDELKTAFLANMSHEIRTPMNAIVGFSGLIKDEKDSAKRSEYVKIIKASSDQLVELINDIIDLSKIEAGDFKLVNSECNLNALLLELEKLYCSKLEQRKKEKPIDFNVYVPTKDVVVRIDYYRLRQVLINLINNALKFTLEGSITTGFKITHGKLLFWVRDTGIGIPDEDQKKIFERFIKFDYTGLNIEGSGIGLSIVEKIVHLFNGKIWLKSKVGKGTSIYFIIPYTPVQP